MSSDSESTDPSQPTKPDDDPTQPYPGQDDPTLAHPGQPVDAGDNDSLRLARQIEDLPFPFGEAVRLRLLAHWPLSRIAEHLGHSTKYVGSLLISGVQMLERATDITQTDPEAHDPTDVTHTGDSLATDVLVDLLERQDRGETIDSSEGSSLHGEVVNHYLEVASQLEAKEFAAAETFTGSYASREPHTGRQTDTVSDLSAKLLEPQAFGDYDLIEQIGRGGMGVVYKARQRKLNRIVALKMILAGKFADGTDVKRFYTEAESAAKLRHANIVAIHEVGEVDGQHFFSMDYIQGQSLRDEARDHPLEPQRAAVLTKMIAEAMQHAHTMGVVHRDLKPANILLDAKDSPLIMDFGLAKRVEEDESGLTYTGQVLGTPSYMPPEQAAGQISKIGPLTDIYSIGAVLYELLTGRPPFRAATAWDTIKQVMQREPVAPRLLNPGVPRDLETVCLKCLQKAPEQRYASAQELSEELGRCIAGEPIKARPIGLVKRLWRWCKRNPKVASSLAATAASISIALVIVSVSLAVTADALEESERSYRKTRDVVDYWFTQLTETPLKNQPGLQKLRHELLQRALEHYQDFLLRHADDPTLREEIALTHFRIGLITASIAEADKAMASLEKALAMQQELLRELPKDLDLRYHTSNTLTEMGRVLERLKRTDEAMQRHLEARDMRKELVAAQPKNVEYARKLANSIMNIGIMQRMKFEFAGARKTIELSQADRQKALTIEPNNRLLKRDLAKGYFNLAAIAVDLQDEAYRKEDWDAADTQRDAAIGDLRKAIKLFEELHRKDANDFNLRVQLAMCYNLLADLHSSLWRDSQIAAEDFDAQNNEQARKEAERLFKQAASMLNEAVELYDDARPIFETLARMNPDVANFQHTLSGLYSNLGLLQIADDHPVKALQAYGLAREVLQELVDRYSDVPDYERDLAQVLRAIASAQAHPELKQWDDAAANMDEAEKILKRLVNRYPTNKDYQLQLEDTRAGIVQLGKMRKSDGP